MTVERVLGALVAVVAVVFTGGCAAVFRLHFRALRRRPKGGRGLLSWHIAAIALSVIGLELFVALGILDKLGLVDVESVLPFVARLTGYFVFSLLGCAALAIIGRAQLKVYATPPVTEVTEKRSTVVDPGS